MKRAVPVPAPPFFYPTKTVSDSARSLKACQPARSHSTGMYGSGPSQRQRPREWRRRVSLRARVRVGPAWADGRILNISSRGLMVQLSRPVERGKWIELREGSHSIVGEVVWRSGSKAGIRSDVAIAIEEWLAKSDPQVERVSQAHPVERRSAARRHERSRTLAHRIEFAAIGAIGLAIAVSMSLATIATLAAPLAKANEALRG